MSNTSGLCVSPRTWAGTHALAGYYSVVWLIGNTKLHTEISGRGSFEAHREIRHFDSSQSLFGSISGISFTHPHLAMTARADGKLWKTKSRSWADLRRRFAKSVSNLVNGNCAVGACCVGSIPDKEKRAGTAGAGRASKQSVGLKGSDGLRQSPHYTTVGKPPGGVAERHITGAEGQWRTQNSLLVRIVLGTFSLYRPRRWDLRSEARPVTGGRSSAIGASGELQLCSRPILSREVPFSVHCGRRASC